MTEKKMNPDRELTPEEQQQLEGEEQFFKQQFSSLPSPKLPGSLSAQAMWEKICAGEGDHQITVDPTQMEPPAPQKPEGKVLDFPGSHKTEEKPKRNLTVHRRRWAIACTLVLVVGLSAAYWKWQRPMEQMKDMVTAESAAEQPVEEVAEEAAEEDGIDLEPKAEITYDDFAKLQFQIGEIVKCEAVPKSKKLLCSQVKIGTKTRQIISGIKAHYSPEEMVGKKVMVVTNLKPAKLAGVVSEGMILCAEDAEGNLSLMVPEKKMPAGAEIC